MVRWFRISGKQYLGFWALGLLLFALQEAPYILMPLFRLGSDPIMHMEESSAALNAVEKILGSLCVAAMVFIVHEDARFFSVSSSREKAFFALAVMLLLANHFGWALYFSGLQSDLVMLLFIVALPPLYYAAIGLWRRNAPLTVLALAFLAAHFIHVYGNLKGGGA